MGATALSIPFPFFTGLGTSAGLIIAIGAQNAYVLSQGLRGQHQVMIALTCALLDTLLITLGVAGMGILISQSPLLLKGVTVFGVLFLIGYGFTALRSAFSSRVLEVGKSDRQPWQQVLFTTLAISLLNPHVYLDTLVFLGGMGGRYPSPERYWFSSGASLFSFIWFFSLSLGGRRLAPLFSRAIAWRLLDLLICTMMWGIAALLLWELLA